MLIEKMVYNFNRVLLNNIGNNLPYQNSKLFFSQSERRIYLCPKSLCLELIL